MSPKLSPDSTPFSRKCSFIKISTDHGAQWFLRFCKRKPTNEIIRLCRTKILIMIILISRNNEKPTRFNEKSTRNLMRSKVVIARTYLDYLRFG